MSVHQIGKLRVRTSHDYPPIPDRRFDWSAVDDDTYDGAEDSSNRNHIGYGATEDGAIGDLIRLLAEIADEQGEPQEG